MNFLFAVFYGFILIGAGLPIIAACDRGGALRFGERVLFAFAVGLFLSYLLVYAVAPFRLDAASMWGVVAVLAVVAAFGLRRFASTAWITTAVRGFDAAPLATRLVMAALVATTVLTLIQALAPPNDYDSLTYHLTIPQLDLERGREIAAWGRDLPHSFFPALLGHQSRLALAIVGSGAAQMLHGLLTAVGGGAVAALVLRLRGGRFSAVMGALLFLTIRMVIWQMGSVEVDAPQAALSALALLAYTVWREDGRAGPAVLFGAMVGCVILAKYTGFAVALAFGPLILFDAATRRKGWPYALLLGPAVAALVIAPHAIRNYVLTGNPVFPILNPLFNRGGPDLLVEISTSHLEGLGFVELVTTWVKMFILPTHLFDGMMIGSPYLLALAPLILLDFSASRRWLPVVSVVATFYALWFFFLGHQVRFLLPVLSGWSAVAAAGLAAVWCRAADARGARVAIVMGFVALMGIQGIFWCAYVVLRLPVVFDLVPVATYLTATPTMDGSFYTTCGYIRNHLKPGERYYSLLQPHSYYCPQASAVVRWFPDQAGWWARTKTPPRLDYGAFVDHIADGDYRFLIIAVRWENRTNLFSRVETGTIAIDDIPYGAFLAPALVKMKPLIEGRYTAVYDGRELLLLLKELPDPTAGKKL